MAANSSIILTNIDFDTHKNTLKQYLKSQDRFKDYDFEGSNINVLLDILSYNTYHNAFYLNMIGNEMFMDTAQLRDSVVSHAKELNYTPRSFKSAEANVNITVVSNDTSKRSIAIPRGTTFTSPFMNRNYTFSTNENIVITDYTINSNNTVSFLGSNITLYEGYYVTDTFTYTSERSQRFVLTNKNVDVSSLIVTVIEDVGNTVLTHTRAQSLFNLNSDSRVYFLQACENDQYEILMGDGVSGRKPKDNSIISVEYRISLMASFQTDAEPLIQMVQLTVRIVLSLLQTRQLKAVLFLKILTLSSTTHRATSQHKSAPLLPKIMKTF